MGEHDNACASNTGCMVLSFLFACHRLSMQPSHPIREIEKKDLAAEQWVGFDPCIDGDFLLETTVNEMQHFFWFT